MWVYQRVTPKYPKLYNPKTTISDHFHWENPLPDPFFWGFHLFNNKIGMQTKNLMQIPLKNPSVFFHCCFQNLQCWYCFFSTTFSSSNFSIFQNVDPFSKNWSVEVVAAKLNSWHRPSAQRPESDAPLRVAADPWGGPPYLADIGAQLQAEGFDQQIHGLLRWAMGKIRDSTG